MHHSITRFLDYPMLDVLIVGAGPAGAVAGDDPRARRRARAPRRSRDVPARQAVRRHGQSRARSRACGRSASRRGIDERSLRVDGMRVTGERGVDDRGALSRRPVGPRDHPARARLAAAAAGDRRRLPVRAGRRGPAARSSTSRAARGRSAARSSATGGRESPIAARVTIAADGRHSTIAFGLGLARHPPRPRRWAIGAYFENFMPIGVRPGVRP